MVAARSPRTAAALAATCIPAITKIGAETKMHSQLNSNLDEAALRNQLAKARLKISSLEDYIRQRELAFQVRTQSPTFVLL